MTGLVSIDLGYGYVKAVGGAGKGRVMFPSVLAPAADSPVEASLGLGNANRPGHYVELRQVDSLKRNRLLIGDLAVREGRAVQFTLARERFTRDSSLALAMTAAYLTGVEGKVSLGFGVSLAYYRRQKFEVQKSLQDVSLHVSVDNGPERLICFASVDVFPQGVGALFSCAQDLPEKGLLGLIDVGYHTTDYLLVELRPDGIDPLTNFTSSVEVGVHTAHKLFADSFRQLTGQPLTLAEAQAFWSRGEASFEGRRIDLGPLIAAARQATGQAIAETVLAAWSEKTAFLDSVLLAGGGALEFLPMLEKYWPGLQVMPDPQFANAVGFYLMAQSAAGMVK